MDFLQGGEILEGWKREWLGCCWFTVFLPSHATLATSSNLLGNLSIQADPVLIL